MTELSGDANWALLKVDRTGVRETDEEAEMRERRAERPAPDRSIMAPPKCCCKEGLIERAMGHRRGGSYSIQLESTVQALQQRWAYKMESEKLSERWSFGYGCQHAQTGNSCRVGTTSAIYVIESSCGGWLGDVGCWETGCWPLRRHVVGLALPQSCWHWAKRSGLYIVPLRAWSFA